MPSSPSLISQNPIIEPITPENYKIVHSGLYHDMRLINPTITSKHIPVSTFKPTVLETFTPKPKSLNNNSEHTPPTYTTPTYTTPTYTTPTYTTPTYTTPTYTSYKYEPTYSSSPKTVHVRGYYRKDGTYIRPHYRSAPRRR